MKISNTILVVVLSVFSVKTIAVEEHHNIQVNNCRVHPSGNIQILGLSDSDNINKSLTFSPELVSEKVLDRYLSLCLSSIASGLKLRIDYLDCTGGQCTPKTGTTVQIIKPN